LNRSISEIVVRILGIETSGLRGSVALVEGDRVVAFAEHSEPNRHAEETLQLIERILDEVGWQRTSLERVAVSVGPGSFTGVRVGLALAEGLRMGLGIPALGLGSLRVAAASARLSGDGLTPGVAGELSVVLRDARRQEFFLGAYDAHDRERLAPVAIPQEGAEAAIAARFSGEPYRLVRSDPDARAVALLVRTLEPSEHPLTPLYVRDSGATPQNIPVSPLTRPRLE